MQRALPALVLMIAVTSTVLADVPTLTREEEEKLDEVIARFVQVELAKLRGEEARKAIRDFEALKTDAIPALVRGLHRAAKNNQSCPVLTISKKLNTLLLSCNDPQMLEFARDELGAELSKNKYHSTFQNLRLTCMLRKNALGRMPAVIAVRDLPKMTIEQLGKAATTARGPQLLGVVAELAKRDDQRTLAPLAGIAATGDKDAKAAARAALDAYLGPQTVSYLREQIADKNIELRLSAIRVVASKKHTDAIPDLIDRVTDDSKAVRSEVRAALKTLSKGQDFGPEDDATRTQQKDAQKKWREWWLKRN